MTSRIHQQGASLVIVMILLLVMTLLGLAVLRSTLLEERMSANLFDRSLSFQAAEAALRDAETVAGAADIMTRVPANACNDGICALPDASAVDRWQTATPGWKAAGVNMGALASAPVYLIEYMGDAPSWPGCDLVDETNRSPLCMRPRFRITARSEAADRASVMLQTNFIAP